MKTIFFFVAAVFLLLVQSMSVAGAPPKGAKPPKTPVGNVGKEQEVEYYPESRTYLRFLRPRWWWRG